MIIPIKWLFHWEYNPILFSDKPIWTWEHSANDLVSWWSNELVMTLVMDILGSSHEFRRRPNFPSWIGHKLDSLPFISGHIHLVLGWLYIQLYHSPLHPRNLLPVYFIHIPFLERLICGTSRKRSVRWRLNGGHRCSAHVNHGVLAGYWPATQTWVQFEIFEQQLTNQPCRSIPYFFGPS